MLCKKCTRCGLCEGDGSFPVKENLVIVSSSFTFEDVPGRKDSRINEIGIAIDIGTTTFASCAVHLSSGKVIAEYKSENFQSSFGSDVIARISAASDDTAFRKIKAITLVQVNKAVQYLAGECAFYFMRSRIPSCSVREIIIAGNTAMETFAAGEDVQWIQSLGVFPFRPASLFGKYYRAADFFASLRNIPVAVNPECPIYVAPCIGAFAGGDLVCGMVAAGMERGLDSRGSAVKYIADVGTNCEMAVFNSEKNILYCTSSACGPAFEGQGIELGMAACEGAVAKVMDGGEISVIGNCEGRGICGSGLLDACSWFYRKGIINSNGTFGKDEDRYFLTEKVYLSQKDVRNFQLAKSAVYSGLEVLKRYSFSDSSELELYLAGGFGTCLDEANAVSAGMIPENFRNRITHAGNCALSGACMMLLDEKYRTAAENISCKTVYIDLALEEGFQKLFIDSLNFPE